MKRIKNKSLLMLFISISVIVALVLTLKYTFASLTDNDSKQNDFKAAEYKGSIKEKFAEPTENNPIKINSSYQKEVKISNEEDVRLFVRVMILPKAVSKIDRALMSAESGKDFTLTIDNNWLDGDDGYYYYSKIVNSNEQTTALFSAITLLNPSYENADFSIELKAETVAAYSTNYQIAFWGGEPDTDQLKMIDQTYTQELSK